MKVGITGHQKLGDQNLINWIRDQIELQINKLDIDQAFSCLAIGADQLFAKIVLRNKIPLTAVIPSHNYEITFDKKNIEQYKDLLNKCTNKIQLAYEAPSEQAFFVAGKLIVDNCDLIFAVWNNQPAKGLGGTGDIVNYAIKIKKRIVHINPLTQTIKIL